MKPLISYVAKARRLSKEQFLAEEPDHVLVVEPFVSLEETGFQTLVGSELREGTPMVARLAKRDQANAFASMITLGRAGNNDIELKNPAVSKFHAYFQPQGKDFLLVDGNSTFGTFVGDRRLEPRSEKHTLRSGERLGFGKLQATYYDPEGFYALLQQELGQDPPTKPWDQSTPS